MHLTSRGHWSQHIKSQTLGPRAPPPCKLVGLTFRHLPSTPCNWGMCLDWQWFAALSHSYQEEGELNTLLCDWEGALEACAGFSLYLFLLLMLTYSVINPDCEANTTSEP